MATQMQPLSIEAWERRARNAEETIFELHTENERLRAALTAFAEHFGPLEDNHMLSDEVRKCFKLARDALSQR
jgi:xanthine dehydrogenase iron-sulfur cluster and FAD-binding subunit A